LLDRRPPAQDVGDVGEDTHEDADVPPQVPSCAEPGLSGEEEGESEVAEAKDRTHSGGSADPELVRFSDADRLSSSTER
jgi:hypothetical protein